MARHLRSVVVYEAIGRIPKTELVELTEQPGRWSRRSGGAKKLTQQLELTEQTKLGQEGTGSADGSARADRAAQPMEQMQLIILTELN